MSTNDPTDIRAREKAELDQQDKDRLTQRREADDFKWLMAHPQGRRIVWGILEDTHVYHSSFTGNSETFFKEGERNIGLKIILKINAHSPERYATMIKEANDDDQRKSNAD